MRTRSVALDASCVGKLFLDEPESHEFRAWYRQMRDAGASFLAPALLQFELGNIVRRQFRDREDLGRILSAALDGIALVEVDPARPFHYRRTLTYYDAAYATAAEEAEALATYDAALAAAPASAGMLTLVWDARRIRAAAAPGFVRWLKASPTRRQPLRELIDDVRRDSFVQDDWSFLQCWGYLDEYRKPGDRQAASLDLAFADFAAR